MLHFKVDIAKNFFFDRPLVMRAVDAARKRVLSKFGAFIRRTAKGLIRKRKKSSPPGKPPSSHTGVLREFIYFAFDPAVDSVVIGPAKTNQVFFADSGRPVTGTVPSVLEFGGHVNQLDWFVPSLGWRRADLRRVRRSGRKTRMRKIEIAARPFMQPALEENLPKFPSLWSESVTVGGNAA